MREDNRELNSLLRLGGRPQTRNRGNTVEKKYVSMCNVNNKVTEERHGNIRMVSTL